MLDNLHFVKMQKKERQGKKQQNNNITLPKECFWPENIKIFYKTYHHHSEHCWLGLSLSETEICYHVDFSLHKIRLSGIVSKQKV